MLTKTNLLLLYLFPMAILVNPVDTNLNNVAGAIPVLNQVMSATRGATDAFSGVSQHVNITVSLTFSFHPNVFSSSAVFPFRYYKTRICQKIKIINILEVY